MTDEEYIKQKERETAEHKAAAARTYKMILLVLVFAVLLDHSRGKL